MDKLFREYMVSYFSRKYVLTVAAMTISSVALFKHLLTGLEYVSVITLVLGMYKAANVISQKEDH